MPIPVPKVTQPPKIDRLSNRAWVGGYNSQLDIGRTPNDGLTKAVNVRLYQDGTIGPRPSLVQYGPQPAGTILGEIYEFRSTVGTVTTNRLISLQTIPQNEVQTLTITGTPTGGTFTLTYSGQTTSAIAYNASASTVQTALIALSNLDVGDVVCTGGNLPGTPVVMTFGGTLANTNVAAITSTSSLTGGTSPTITITETVKGGNTTYVHIARGEDLSWTKVTGKTYDNASKGHFCQLDNKVLIMNGTDALSYLDTLTLGVVPFTALTTPLIPTIAATGLSGTTYTYYYVITANSTVGETAASPIANKQVSLVRGAWDSTANFLTISWTAVSGAQSYNVYVGETSGAQYLIASAVTGTSFKDDGSAAKDVTHPAPIADTTAGPKVTRGTEINGQVFLTGDSDHPDYVRFGGKGAYALDFSPYNGGGWVSIGKGTKYAPVNVKPFRTGQGDPVPMVISKGTNGAGKRHTMQDANVTVGGEVITYFDVKEDNGQDGTDSPDGIASIQDQLIYPSRDGFKSTFTKAQIQNILSTETISENIETDVRNLNIQAMDMCVQVARDGIVYWALPVGSETNNQIWLLDLGNSKRKGAWMLPYNISADWMNLYEDNSGTTHHLVLSGNVIYEFSNIQSTMDGSTAFPTDIASGQLRFSEDGEEWATVTLITFILLRPKGTINFSVYGRTEDNDQATVAVDSRTYAPTNLPAGWGEAGWGILGWGDTVNVPISSGVPRQKVQIEIDEDMNYVSWEITSSLAGTNYQLSDVIVQSVNIGLLDSDS